jgi:hypothetical protein
VYESSEDSLDDFIVDDYEDKEEEEEVLSLFRCLFCCGIASL